MSALLVLSSALLIAFVTGSKSEVFYLLSFGLVSAASSIGARIDATPIERPMLPQAWLLVSALSGLAGLVGLALFVYGFFAFAWWMPLVAVLIAMLLGSSLTHWARRSAITPLWGFVYSLAGIAFGGATLATR